MKILYKSLQARIVVGMAALAFSFLLALSPSMIHAQTIDIGPNQYAFRLTSNPNFGLYFNASAVQYEFRNSGAVPIFAFNANSGRMTTNLELSDDADYMVPGNRYAFRSKNNPNYGLYFNANALQYEFRNSAAAPIFSLSASSGDLNLGGGVNLGNTTSETAGTLRWNGSDIEGHDGTEWKSLTEGATPGPQGPAGPAGPAGPQGAAGPQGPAGTYTTGVGIDLSGNQLSAQNDSAIWNANKLLGKPIFPVENIPDGHVLRYSNFHDDWYPSQIPLTSRWSGLANGGIYFQGNPVGIGTNTPTNGFALDVSGDFMFRSLFGKFKIGYHNNGNQWALSTNEGGKHMIFQYKPEASNIFSTRITFTDTGNLGVGVSTPTAPLHVSGGNWDINNNDGDILIGNTDHKLKMSIATGGGGAGTARINSMGTSPSLLLGAGGYSALNITGNAGTGQGTAWAALEMKFGSSRSLVFERIFGGDPAIRPDANGWGSLGLENHRFWRAYVNTYYGTNTSIQSISDASLKENVVPMEKGLEKLMKLNPVNYDFIAEKLIEETEGRERLMDQDIKDQMGFIAQEVQEIFPQLVRPLSERSDILTLGYSGLIPVIVQAIKEQQSQIADLSPEGMVSRQEFEALKAENEQLKSRLNQVLDRLDNFDHDLESCCFGENNGKAHSDTRSSDAPSLGQNIPNPFRESTVIQYYLPENTSSAIIRVLSLEGKPVKDFILGATHGRNQVEVHTSGLAVGTYLYSLFVDGELINTKRMMIAR